MKNQITWLALRSQRVVQAGRAIRSFAIHSITLLMLVTAGALQALAQQVDGGMPGPYPVGHTSFVTKAQDNGRLVAVDVYYPADASKITAQSPEAVYAAKPYDNKSPIMTSSQWEAFGHDRAYEGPAPAKGPFALIMFNPGMSFPGWSYVYLGTRLASHGFVVAVHESYRDVPWPPSLNAEWYSQKFFYRPRDLSSALTEVLKRDETKGHVLQNLIDRRYIVAAGHSLGGYAALVEFAGDDQVCDTIEITRRGEKNPPTSVCQASPPDPRFTALICLDAGSHLLRWEELSRIRVPSLIMGQAYFAAGAYVSRGLVGYETWIARPHAAICTQARAVRVDIKLAVHNSFAAACDGFSILHNDGVMSDADLAFFQGSWCSVPVYDTDITWGLEILPDREVQRMITKYVVAWLRAEVLKDGSELSKRILTQSYAKTQEPNINIYWNEDCAPVGSVPPGMFGYSTDMNGGCVIGEKDPAGFFIPYP